MPHRPQDLPDYKTPPLHEVVLGVQFSTPDSYRDLHAYEVWKLFAKDFPIIEERPLLEPNFEIFGQPERGMTFSFGPAPTRGRYWFVAEDNIQLIQFQQDRLLHNWRKVPSKDNEYPRFEAIIERFEAEINKVNKLFKKKGWGQLKITQCELTYLNHLALIDQDGKRLSNCFYYREIGMGVDSDEADISFSIRKMVKNREGEPVGRLYVESGMALVRSNEPIISLNLTVRGAPIEDDIPAAIKFLSVGRETVVQAFTKLTSEEAHAKWGRTK